LGDRKSPQFFGISLMIKGVLGTLNYDMVSLDVKWLHLVRIEARGLALEGLFLYTKEAFLSWVYFIKGSSPGLIHYP